MRRRFLPAGAAPEADGRPDAEHHLPLAAAIAGIGDANKIRVVLYANGRLVHVSLAELLAAVSKKEV